MSVPVLSVGQMREWEQATWAAGQTPEAVIRRVGETIAARVCAATREGDTVLLLAGKGHNGDDARMAVPHLHRRVARLIDVRDPAQALREVATALERRPALVVDGLFGIGLDRPLTGAWAALVDTVNASRSACVLAVDVPSGLDADTGCVHGAVVRASVTWTLGAPKRGLLEPRAGEYVGRLELAPDIGLVPCPCSSALAWTVPGDFLGFPPLRPEESHKGVFGHVLIIAGSEGYHGAAVLAARGALAAAPGLVSVWTTPGAYIPVASQLQAAMVHPWRAGAAIPTSCTAVLAGPGLAGPDVPEALRAEVVELWARSQLPMVADASALDWLPAHRLAAPGLRVLTPHPGEAARLLGSRVAEVQSDRVAALRRLASAFASSWVVLKGRHTLVGGCDGTVFANSTGNPWLAQGGSGDVLAGYASGFLAQPGLQRDAVRTLRYAVWRHGAAADTLALRDDTPTVERLVSALRP